MKKIVILLLAATTIVAAVYGQDCIGTAKSGKPCKAHALKNTNYCRVHNPSAIHCVALTKAGKPCMSVVNALGDTCHVHKKGGKK